MSRQAAIAFAFVAVAVFGAEAVVLSVFGDGTAVAWLTCAGIAALLAAAAAALFDAFVLRPMQAAEAHRDTRLRAELAAVEEGRKHLRHEIRGALSPALLTADRLLTNADPAIRRAGEMMVRGVERATVLLSQGDELPHSDKPARGDRPG